ncbi:autotransporter outer membrane beta-barrel domain-containing protein [Acuticoccus yangtzensis]|uniref:autotransporter outer membrane beta-barrel domain-containing protein n=1 Tax=Acuticoccus yangtzensis TaxID=1443441 RepID=UPI0009F82020|nr:autotransporter outer membrane beta-barrel domain-containing protein [Acuticoccus yangtzensis]
MTADRFDEYNGATAAKSTSRETLPARAAAVTRPRGAAIRRIASTLLLQSTALAGTMAGVPLAVYSRAYAQASCSPSVSSYTIDGSQKFDPSDVAQQRQDRADVVFTCTITSDSALTTPQYGYAGAYAYYLNTPAQELYLNDGNYVVSRHIPAYGRKGLSLTATNSADITVTDKADTSSFLPNTAGSALPNQQSQQGSAFSIYSHGSMASFNAYYYNNTVNPAGDGGAISITNTGALSSSVGAGIAAVSVGNMQPLGGLTGKGGAVTIVTSGDVAGSAGGIVALSQGGMSTIQDYSPIPPYAVGGKGGTVSVTVTGAAKVAATSTGAGIFAGSYGGNALYQPNPFGQYLYGGPGGKGGDVTVALGTASDAFTGEVSSTAAGTNPGETQLIRKTGAAVAAVSQGGRGVAVGVTISEGGHAGDVNVTANGSSDTLIHTSGDASFGILAQSVAGLAQAEIGESYKLSGGDGGTVTVDLAGGGSITTAGENSSAIVAQSLGGAGQNNDVNTGSAYGDAGSGGVVNVTSDFALSTAGMLAHGIVGQSMAASIAGAIYDNPSDQKFVVGDVADSATGAQSVTITNHGAITTKGVDSAGIIAQSIGGGGGMVHSTADLSTDSRGVVNSSAFQGVGGYAGTAAGNDVTVNNYGAITTYGGTTDSSGDAVGGGIGILAQSIGGGGGINTGSGAYGALGGAGNSTEKGSDGGTVTVWNRAAITTAGDEGHGVLAQSIGGGGGMGRNEKGLFRAVGGSGGAGGDGGAVTVHQHSDIAVSGDYAAGVIAQSIGGGGGNGGSATAFGLFGSSSVGGAGGAGGDAAKAEVLTLTSSKTETTGDHGIGIHVQSIGGGGGTGGAAKSTSDGLLFSFALATGGTGGSGGAGGEAEVEHYGAVTTTGTDAIGALIQSIGGGGGAGGTATTKATSLGMPIDEDGDSLSLNLTISHGGVGGDGGDAGEAVGIVQKSASIVTSGDGATGLHIQSIGGSGGAGGDATATSVSKSLGDLVGDDDSKPISADLNLTIGGAGAGAGDGAKAYGHVLGTISTSGALADGMLVQSVGGGGGAGGAGAGTAKTVKHAVSGTLNISVGAAGGGGGTGGLAMGGLASGASVTAKGLGARGIVVQSVGGGGGSGGGGTGNDGADWTVTVGLGGTGGPGGDGGTVYAWNAGAISTSGDDATGLIAQSVGGGGGTAGLGTSSITHTEEKKKEDDDGGDDDGGDDDDGDGGDETAILVGDDDDTETKNYLTVGDGTGGGGGTGGTIYVGIGETGGAIKRGTIVTTGDVSHGVLAQSVGGGGGAGAVTTSSDSSSSSSSSSDSSSDDSGDDPDVTLTMGSSGGLGGNGRDVTVYASTVTTSGFGSSAIIAQSIGGGGGTGTSSGFAVPKVKVSLGAKSSENGGGTGGTVTVDVLDGETLKTGGDSSHGVVAQSVGGGGGLGIVALGTADLAHDDTLQGVISVELGTNGGTSDPANKLFANTVTVDHKGHIETAGDRSIGIIAQSIGGGGGFLSASSQNFDGGVNWVSDQSAAAGADVTVSLEGATIVTSGDGAFGILAQSISGGGGAVTDTSEMVQVDSDGLSSYSYAHGTATSSGQVAVTLDSTSSIATSGFQAHGIMAQSIAGGGGLILRDQGSFAGSLNRNAGSSNSGGVTVDVNGSVSTTSSYAWSVWTQTQDGTVDITIGEGGTVSGAIGIGSYGDNLGGAVYASVGTAGTINVTNNGTLDGDLVTTYNVATGQSSAVRGAAPTVTTVPSNSAPSNSPPANSRLVNTGTFRTGGTVAVNNVLNAGTMTVGKVGDFAATTVHGDLTSITAAQARRLTRTALPADARARGRGHLAGVDVDMEKGLSDQLVVKGDFAGDWDVSLNVATLLPNVRAEFLAIEGAATGTIDVEDSLIFGFSGLTTGANGRSGVTVEQANFDAAGAGLSRNRQEAARALQSAWDTIAAANGTRAMNDGGPTMGEMFGAFHGATADTYDDMVAQLVSHTALGPLARAPSMAVAAANSAMACEGFATGAILEDGACMWGTVNGAAARYDGYDGDPGYSLDAYGVTGGAQFELGGGWFVGGTVGYENGAYSGNGATLDTDTAFGALSVKKEIAGFTVGLAAGGGYTWGDGSRTVVNGAFVGRAESEPNSSYLFARARGAYTLALNEWAYVRPALDFDVISVNQESYRESGAGALNLDVAGATETFVVLTPSVEMGARVNVTETLPTRIFATAGVSFFSEDEFTSKGRLAGVPSMETFDTKTSIGDALARVGIGVDLSPAEGFEVKLQYDGAFSEEMQSHGGSLRIGYRF